MQDQTTGFAKRACNGGIAVALAAALSFVPALAFADPTSADVQAEAQTALANLATLQDELGRAEASYHDAVAEQEAAKAKMNEAQARIDEANGRISDLQRQLGLRARSMYRSGSSTFLDLILGATTFEEFATNWDILNQLNENDAALVQQTKDLRAEVESQKAEYEAQEQVAAQKAAEAEQIKAGAEADVAAMQATYDSLSAEAAALLEQEQAAQEAAEAAAAQQVVEEASKNTANRFEPAYNAVTGNSVVDRAYSYVGNAEYVWAACRPGAFDCSGFVSYCLTGSYSRLGSTSTFLGWQQVSNPQPGDVAVNNGHCGIYIGGGQMIHAASPGQGVCVGPVQSGMIFVRY